MKFLENIEDILTSSLERLRFGWWIEIVTDKPHCTYYFGPFVCPKEAQKAQVGYIEDLEKEKAQVITLKIRQFQPKELTICEDEWVERMDSSIKYHSAQYSSLGASHLKGFH